MPPLTPTHANVLDAIKRCEILSELVQEENGKFIHEADVETIVYGRQYAGGKQVGPYVELLEYDPGTVIITEGQSVILEIGVTEANPADKQQEQIKALLTGSLLWLEYMDFRVVLSALRDSEVKLIQLGREE